MRTDQSDGSGRPANRLTSRSEARRTQDLLRGGRLARIGGAVVSFAPTAGAAGVMMSVSALAIAALGALSGDARAQATCSGHFVPDFNCTGPGTITSTQLRNNGTGNPLNATIASGVEFETTAGNALTLSSNGGISLTQSGADKIYATAAGGRAIYASNRSNGNVTITVLGSVRGGQHGIRAAAQGTATTGSITITAVNVSALSSARDTAGIYVWALGSNPVSVTTTGNVAGGHSGIDARAETAGANAPITINAATVSGVENGIFALATAASAMQITSTGHVSASHVSRGYGIKAEQASLSAVGNIAISAESATGAKRGILVNAIGSTGDISISASGDVIASHEDGFGIEAFVGNPNTNKSVTINAAKVTGGKRGIEADIAGQGSVSITATGLVVGTDEYGIYATIRNTSGGALSITAANSVNGGEAGVWANNNSSGTIAISVAGTASGGIGIDARAADGDVTISAATVRGTATTGTATGIKVAATGTGNVSISASGTVMGTGTSGIGIDASASGGDVTISAAAVTGSDSGIKAVTIGTGNVSISASGLVSSDGTGGIGIDASAADGDVTISAAAVTGMATAIKASATGAGNVSISASGGVSSAGTGGIGIDASAADEDVTITAAAVTGTYRAIKAVTGAGDVSISASGALTGTGTDGIGIEANSAGGNVTITAAAVTGTDTGIEVVAAGDGDVSLSASGAVTGTSADGIIVSHIGAGATTITVTAAVTGGIGANVAAIRTNVRIGRDVTISLGSGASVGAGGRNAIVGGSGNTSVAVNTGATISGKINLGDGDDTLTFASGTFSDITELHGGDGSRDALTFSGVSGSVTGLAGWETVNIDGGSEIRLASGSGTIEGNLNVSAGAIFEIGNDADSDDDLTISGNFAGGGTITFDVNFTETAPASDSLTITQNVTGVTVIDVNQFGSGSATGLDRPGEIDLITVQGTVDAAAFTFEKITFQNATYRLRTKTENSETVFYLFRSGINDCLETVDGSGIFTCSGTGLISDPQNLGASGSTDLRVTLDSETPVTVAYEDAFSLTQPGAADIVLVQLIDGQDITGKDSGIIAHNTSGGSISIDVNGSVTGEAGDGIRASSDTSGTGIAIIAASVSGAKSGIVAIGSGAGDVSVSANGAVAGTADYGIHARTGLSGTGLTVSAGTVTGGKTGIRALGSGTGGVSVIATGAVVGTADYGIHARTGLSGTGLTVSAGAVTGGKTGIRALGSGTGGVSVTATGAVVGTRDYGIYAMTAPTGTGLTVSAGAVTGGKTGIRALGSGTGGVSVTATGAVVGTEDYGIYAMTASTGTDLTVSAGAVTGGKTGIKAVGSGSGAVSVAATGEVMGSGTIGVIVSGGTGTGDMTVSVATVSGEDGIDARQTGTGNLTVRARSVMAKRGGVRAVGSGAGNVTVNVDGSVHVEGDEAWGVDALASGDGDLSVTLGSVTAGAFAVKAISSGAGSVSVSASYARARRSSGGNNNEIVAIQASGGSTSTGVAVAVGTAFSSEVGIDAVHAGTGELSVTATGSVTGTRTVGIRAKGSNSADVRIHAEKLVQSDADGIYAKVSGSGDMTINVASVMGENHGIKAENTGTGGVSIGATGAVRAVSKDTQSSTFSEVGIWARVSGAGALRIAAASVTGDNYGIDAKSDGEGAVSVVSTGLVEGNKKAGIKAIGGTATASVAVTAATVTSSEGAGIDAQQRGGGALTVTATETVSGNTWGIMAVGSGDGAVSVSATGTVTGASEHGIEAMGMKAVSVAAAAVSGMKTGILAKSEGSGSVSVEASGAVTGEAEHGISAISESTGISVAVATVTGKKSGIHAENKGSGLVSVRASGTVTGESEHGIEARSMDGGITVETAAVSGAKSGILADNKGAGSVRVVASGSVTTTSSISGMHGVHAMNSASGSAISIETRAAVTARKNAIHADNSGGDVRVTSAAAVDGGDYGVRVKAVSGIDLSLDGVIGRSERAVYATNSESGDVVIALRGAVEGSGSGNHGIHAINEGSQSGAMFIRGESPATVSGMQSGVVADNRGTGLLTIDLKAAVAGEEGYGIRAVNSGEGITIRAGSASGATHGIFAEGVAGQLQIDATGSVAGTGSDADGIRAINRGSALTRIVVSGPVSGEKSGIHAENSYSYASGMAVEVARSASVSGKVDGIRLANRQEEGAIALTVTGRVEGGSGFGVHAQAGDAPVTVDVTGTVTGTSDSGGGAVRIENVAGRNLAEVAVRSGGQIDAGSGTAIWNGDGNAVVRMDGGRIAGRIALGGGDDQFIWNGGNMSGVTELDGGERAGNDRIRILSDMTAAQTEGLLRIPGVRNWDEISIEGNATASFLGADNADITLSALRIKENATVSFVNSSTDDRVTMRGDLIGERGTLAMDVSFSEREADRLTLDGGTAQGTTMISIVNPSGDLPSVDQGIVLVEVVGAQNVSKSAFELSAASARRGLFANTLTRETRNGSTVFSIQTSDRLGEFGSILQVTPALVRGAFKNLPMRPYGDSGNLAPWLRAGGERLNIGASEMREEASSDVFRLEGGVDLMQVEGAGGSWTFGVSAQHTTMSGRTTVDGGNGSVDTQAFGIGATASWRGESNFFFDAAGQVNRSKSDISTDGSGVLVRDTRMDARAVGAAMGRRISAGSGIYLMPKVEFAYGQVSGSEFAAQGGIDGDFGSSNFFTAGIGSRIEFPTRSGSAYLSGSIVEDFADKSNVSAGGFDIAVEADPMEVRLGFGGYREVGEGARLMLEGAHVFSVGGDSGKRVSGGLSGGIRWEW